MFLGEIGTETSENVWSVNVTLNGSPGADVTVISEGIYKDLRSTSTLVESSKTLFGPAHTTLPVHGCFTGTIQQGEKATEQEIFVVIGARQALLGRLAIESLKLVKKVNAVNADDVYKEKFPKLFPGLGRRPVWIAL